MAKWSTDDLFDIIDEYINKKKGHHIGYNTDREYIRGLQSELKSERDIESILKRLSIKAYSNFKPAFRLDTTDIRTLEKLIKEEMFY